MGIDYVAASRPNPAYRELLAHDKAGTINEAQHNVLRKPRPVHELFDVSADPHQLNNLADDPAHAEKLAMLQAALDQWAEETGDTVPAPDEMTPDRNDRETWKPVHRSGRPPGGVAPGEATKAWTIHRSGPVRTADLRTGD